MVPSPETPGASVASETILRPASGKVESSPVSRVISFLVSVAFSSGASAVTVTDSAAAPTFKEIGTLRFWFVSKVTVVSAFENPLASTVIL